MLEARSQVQTDDSTRRPEGEGLKSRPGRGVQKLLIGLLLAVTSARAAQAAPIKIAITNADIYALAREIATEEFELSLLCPSTLDPHNLPMRPSIIQKVREADLLFTIGLDHEPWLFDITTASGNAKTMGGIDRSSFVDCSKGVELLQIPSSGSVSRADGDIHVFGNTHYWLNPKYGKVIAFHVTKALSQALPAKSDVIKDRARAVLRDLDRRIEDWKKRMAPFRGSKIVTYHMTWVYLEDFFGLERMGNVEPKPGIPTSPSHLARLRTTMTDGGVQLLLMAPYYNRSVASSVARDVGAELLALSPSVPEGSTYGDHFESLVAALESAFVKIARSGR